VGLFSGNNAGKVAAAFRAEVEPVADEVLAAIAAEVQAYRRPLSGPFGQGVRRGVTEALGRFCDELESGTDPDKARTPYVEVGRGEMRAGRSLEALLAAYRIGARVSWRRLAAAGLRVGLSGEELAGLAEAVFAYIDELSAASADGYAREQSAAAGERERRRDLLAGLLLDRAEPAVLDDAARAAGWAPPTTLTAVLVDARSADALGPRLGPGTLRSVRGGRAFGLVGDADGPGRLVALARAVRGLSAIVGPAVPWRTVADSAGRAALAAPLVAAGTLPAEDPLLTDDHLGALLLRRDEALLTDLARRRLAPLGRFAAPARARLAETLLAWLSLRGARAEIAAALHVHPQTVRYRLGQLREAFGPDLDDPRARFELELVLRAGADCREPAAGG
jgi:hypothetical protein